MKEFGILFLLFFFNISVFSQTDQYHSKFYNLLEENNRSQADFKSNNILNFYKKYISSQDYKSCPFHPSCSVFAYNAIKKKGLLKGLIMAADRLSRCSEHQIHLYKLNENHKMIDHP